MFGECHAHMLMDGVNYREAVARHRDAVCEEKVREFFEAYQRAGVSFIRDGGDNAGVSKRASEIAGEYGIDYRTPIFAVHKEGHYGRIVGRSFSNIKEFHQRVQEAAEEGADFIKIMTTGLLNFNDHGAVTGTPLDRDEVREMVHIAHEEGFSVMSHTNGIYGVQAAIEAGVSMATTWTKRRFPCLQTVILYGSRRLSQSGIFWAVEDTKMKSCFRSSIRPKNWSGSLFAKKSRSPSAAMQERTVYFMGKESARNISLSGRFWEILTKSGNGWKTEKRSSGKNSDEVKIIEIKNAIILRKLMILRVMAFSDRKIRYTYLLSSVRK